MKEVENINEQPIELNMVVNKENVLLLTGVFVGLRDLFGDKADEIYTKAMDVLATGFQSKNWEKDLPVDKATADEIQRKFGELYAYIEQNIKEDKSPQYSYVLRGKKIMLAHAKKIASGDFDFLSKASNTAHRYGVGTFSNYPLPLFKTGKLNDKGKDVVERDEARYEREMSRIPYLEQYEDRLEYENKYQIPYLKDKEAGTLTPEKEREYKRATYEHLKRQKEYFEKIVGSPVNEKDFDMVPFNYDPQVLKGDWKGDRFGKLRLDQINREINALEHGWSPDDLQIFDDLGRVMTNIEVNGKNLPEERKQELKNAYDKFNSSFAYSKEERDKHIDSIKPLYEYAKEEGLEDIHFEFEVAKKNETFFEPLREDERKRQDMIQSLEKSLKGLSTGHRAGYHSDTTEMDELKKKTKDVIELLKNNRDKSLFEDPMYEKAFDELSKIAEAYTKKKIEKYEKEVRAKLEDPDIKPGTDAAREQERKIFKELKKFKPSSKMGQTRYSAATALASTCKEYTKYIKGEKKRLETLKPLENKGYKIVKAADWDIGSKRPHDRDVKEMMNYFQKNPMVIEEGMEMGVFSQDSFEKTCAPIECNGISEHDFAVVAYASVMDPTKVPQKVADELIQTKSPDITAADKISQVNTMYTLDLAFGRRQGVGNTYGEKIIKPARERAKEAFEKYKKGDITEMADILATGINNINTNLNCIENINGRKTTYHVNAEMVNKMFEFAGKDPALLKAVNEKLGPEKLREVQDNLKLTDYYNKCIDSEARLNSAIVSGKPLTKAEKKECVRNIVAYDFIASSHNQFKNEQRISSAELTEANKLFSELEAPIVMGKYNKLTHDDLVNIQAKAEKNTFKPIEQIHGRFHSKKGMEKLNNIIDDITEKLPYESSEKNIMKRMDGFRKQLNEVATKNIQKANAKQNEMDKQAAEKNKTKVKNNPAAGKAPM